MNILFIGSSFPPHIMSTFINDTKGKNTLAGQNFEQSFISGLSQQEDVCAKVVLVPWVGTYPMSYTKLFVQPESFEICGLQAKSAGYCNLVAINDYCRQKSLAKLLRKTFKEFPEGDIHVIVNTFKYPMLKGLQEARKHSKRKITQTVIMMDMPGFEFTKRKVHPLKKLWMKRNMGKTMEMVGESDYIVAFTKYFLDLFDKPMKHVVIEGMINPDGMHKESGAKSLDNKKVVLYTGTLLKQFGVMNLVDAFERANVSGSELWICGSGGETAEELKARSLKNPAIRFLGQVPSEEAWHMQREATVLVNPRTSEGEYTKYSFPSKTLEYLLSGRPVIVNKLPGFPDEYAEYCIFPKDESVESLAMSIQNVLSMTEEERIEKGRLGREFIMREKNAKRQVGRIIEMIKDNI